MFSPTFSHIRPGEGYEIMSYVRIYMYYIIDNLVVFFVLPFLFFSFLGHANGKNILDPSVNLLTVVSRLNLGLSWYVRREEWEGEGERGDGYDGWNGEVGERVMVRVRVRGGVETEAQSGGLCKERSPFYPMHLKVFIDDMKLRTPPLPPPL